MILKRCSPMSLVYWYYIHKFFIWLLVCFLAKSVTSHPSPAFSVRSTEPEPEDVQGSSMVKLEPLKSGHSESKSLVQTQWSGQHVPNRGPGEHVWKHSSGDPSKAVDLHDVSNKYLGKKLPEFREDAQHDGQDGENHETLKKFTGEGLEKSGPGIGHTQLIKDGSINPSQSDHLMDKTKDGKRDDTSSFTSVESTKRRKPQGFGESDGVSIQSNLSGEKRSGLKMDEERENARNEQELEQEVEHSNNRMKRRSKRRKKHHKLGKRNANPRPDISSSPQEQGKLSDFVDSLELRSDVFGPNRVETVFKLPSKVKTLKREAKHEDDERGSISIVNNDNGKNYKHKTPLPLINSSGFKKVGPDSIGKTGNVKLTEQSLSRNVRELSGTDNIGTLGRTFVAEQVDEDDETNKVKGDPEDRSIADELESDDEEIKSLKIIDMADNAELRQMNNRLRKIGRYPIQLPGSKESLLTQKLKLSKEQLENSIVDMKTDEAVRDAKDRGSAYDIDSSWEREREKEDSWYKDQLNKIRRENFLIQKYAPDIRKAIQGGGGEASKDADDEQSEESDAKLDDEDDVADLVKVKKTSLVPDSISVPVPVSDSISVAVPVAVSGEDGAAAVEVAEAAAGTAAETGDTVTEAADEDGDGGNGDDADDVAETMERLEHKVDDVQSLISTAGLPETRQLQSRKRRAAKPGKTGEEVLLRSSTEHPKPQPSSDVDRQAENRKVNVKRLANSVEKKDSLSENCKNCGQTKGNNGEKDIRPKSLPQPVSSYSWRSKRNAYKGKTKIVYLDLPQGEDGDIFELVGRALANMSVAVDHKTAKDEKTNANSKTLPRPSRHFYFKDATKNEGKMYDVGQIYIGEPKFKAESASSWAQSLGPREKKAFTSRLSNLPGNSLIHAFNQKQKPKVLTQMFAFESKDFGKPRKRFSRTGSESQLFEGLRGIAEINKAQNMIAENVKFGEKEALRHLKMIQADLLQGEDDKTIDAMTTYTLRRLKNILRGLRALRGNAGGSLKQAKLLDEIKSFQNSVRYGDVFRIPRLFNSAREKNSFYQLLRGNFDPTDIGNLPPNIKGFQKPKNEEFVDLHSVVNPRSRRGYLNLEPRKHMQTDALPLLSLKNYISAYHNSFKRKANFKLNKNVVPNINVDENNDIKDLEYRTKASHDLNMLSRALAHLTQRADTIERKVASARQENIDNGVLKTAMIPNKLLSLLEKDLLRTLKDLKSATYSPGVSPASKNREHRKRHRCIEQLVRLLVTGFGNQRQHRSRSIRDISKRHFSHKVDQNSVQAPQNEVLVAIDPEEVEEYGLEKILQDLQEAFPEPAAANVLNSDSITVESTSPSASNAIKTNPKSHENNTKEDPLMKMSAVVDLLVHGSRKRRDAEKETGKKPTGQSLTRQQKHHLKQKDHPTVTSEKRLSVGNGRVRKDKRTMTDYKPVKIRLSEPIKHASKKSVNTKHPIKAAASPVSSSKTKPSKDNGMFKSWLYAYHPSIMLKRSLDKQKEEQPTGQNQELLRHQQEQQQEQEQQRILEQKFEELEQQERELERLEEAERGGDKEGLQLDGVFDDYDDVEGKDSYELKNGDDGSFVDFEDETADKGAENDGAGNSETKEEEVDDEKYDDFTELADKEDMD